MAGKHFPGKDVAAMPAPAISRRSRAVPAAYSEWAADHIKAVVDGLDELAKSMESKWGVGRLRLLVNADLRERFDRQCRKLDVALWDHDSIPEINTEAARMMNAWRALDSVATASGAAEIDPVVWEVPGRDGRVVALVRTGPEASKIVREGRYIDVFTLEEISRLLQALPTVVAAKQVFPGAQVVRVHDHEPVPPFEDDEIDDMWAEGG